MAARRLPDFITIGAQKCGTTSLHRYLSVHPEIGVSRYKEIRFFATGGDPKIGETGNWHRGVDWYVRQFPADRRVWIESFGGLYTDFPREQGVPERIHSVIPQARFLMLVRDPIERIVSHYMHAYCDALEDRPFEAIFDELEHNVYINRSRYYMQLEQYLRWFDYHRFLILDHDDLLDDRRATMAKVFRFVGVDADYWSPEWDVIHHPSSQKRRNNRLGLLLQRSVGNRVFRHLRDHQRHWFRMLAYAAVSTPIPRPVVSPELRARLLGILGPDIEGLERLTGRRFEQWRGGAQ